jgi:hypothetical protein
VDWIQLAKDRVQWRNVNTVMKLRVPTKGREFLDQLRYYKLLKKDLAWSYTYTR